MADRNFFAKTLSVDPYHKLLTDNSIAVVAVGLHRYRQQL